MTDIVPHDRDQTSNFLAESIRNLAEGITGLAASERKDKYLSFGYILQRVRSGRLLETLKGEWDKYRDKGRIKDDYLDTDQHHECLQEMLDFLDRDSPDQIRFNAMKHVFLNSAAEVLSSREDVLPQQYMRICRSLNSAEVLILHANYKLARSGHNPELYGAHEWLRDLANQSVLRYPELVESQEDALMKKGLISARMHSDRSGVVRTENFRLTDLGYELCRYMSELEYA